MVCPITSVIPSRTFYRIPPRKDLSHMLSEEEELFKPQFSEQGATVSLGISIPFYQRKLTMNPKFLLFYHQLEGKII